ncbi:phosphotransferase [Priestia taiwanensis]|uniref:Aminoglycoside phosphotransferase n=1 Tax=Priestia taiwanensis TaxID=1347902 RepID=A0A917ARK9_9BACI|nr:phosphotransferase [Priestia taiwanensis]MBM7363280.1 aminoglycoside phosphotransferase [Priestia taiwanensis]GGE69128.1 aminoglycoside phosphotransferase [Priestia taiwanensis]
MNTEYMIEELHRMDILPVRHYRVKKMSGTTDKTVYRLTSVGQPSYVFKKDNPNEIIHVERFFQAYQNIELFSKLGYVDPEKRFLVYTHIEGTTHIHCGKKINWLSDLVTNFFNHYKEVEVNESWGSLVSPSSSWHAFCMENIDFARTRIQQHLTDEDYNKVKDLVDWLAQFEQEDKKYLVHGDVGVHNMVFDNEQLVGVIDPDALVGTSMYDFTYAFCSSPDDLNVETLLEAANLLNHGPINEQRLIAEVFVSLYVRIGTCIAWHPSDLEAYLEVWEYWKEKMKG